jgi:hypothetical protein
MLHSPFSILYTEILARLKEKVPEIKYIEQDLGQLEHYDMRPPVTWPCCLIDVADEYEYTDMQGNHSQLAEGRVMLRIGVVRYSDSNNLVPDNVRENALAYFEIEQKVFAALHGWAPAGFSRLLRRNAVTEKRDDDIRVRMIPFTVSFTDNSAAPVRTKVLTPAPYVATGLIVRSDVVFVSSFDQSGAAILSSENNISQSDLAFTSTTYTATEGQQVYSTIRPITSFTTIMVFRNGVLINFTLLNNLQIQLVPAIQAGDVIKILQQL